MYALNSFLRLVRFVSNSAVGLFVGFVVGWYFSKSGLDLSSWLVLR